MASSTASTIPAMAMINVYCSPPRMNRKLSVIHWVSKPATEKKNAEDREDDHPDQGRLQSERHPSELAWDQRS